MGNGATAKEIVVSGMGAVTPLGAELETIWQALLAGKTAVGRWEDLANEGFRIPLAARVEHIARDDATRGCRMGVAAARSAIHEVELKPDRICGVFVGTTMGESIAFEQAAEGNNIDLSSATAKSIPRSIRNILQIRGPARAYAAACAAGNYAVGAACEAVASGLVDCALAGGVEPFSRIALAGFSRSRAMSSTVCRPFDLKRSGMQLGEGAAFLFLEHFEDAVKNGRKPLARILGLGLSSDAYHSTAPSPDGEGMARAMESSLNQAGLMPNDIDWICAHGSGTVASDAAEARAIQSLFGKASPPVTGVKGAFGHTLGAATAIEAVVSVMALQKNILPPTVHLENQDPDFGLNLFNKPKETKKLTYVLNCGYGFGGLNSALVLKSI